MSARESLIKYVELKQEGVKLMNKWELFTSSNADVNIIQDIENEITMIQRDKSHYAMRFIEEFII